MILYNYPWYIMLIAAFIAAIWYWPKYKNTPQKYFLFFLAYIIIHEAIGYFYGNIREDEEKNNLVYNLFIIVSFLFYFFWFRKIIPNKRLILLCSLVFIGAILFTTINEGFLNRLWTFPLYVGSICILLCSVLYFSSLIQKKEVVYFYKLQPFWITAGLLIFYIGIIPYFFFEWIKEEYVRYYLHSLNLLLYLCFLISFLCLCKKEI